MNLRCICIALPWLLRVALLVSAPGAVSARDPVDAPFVRLKDRDPEVRIAALRELQTSLDPRLPDALLDLLGDEGNSIRRLAARGVGSRWWQIPMERVPDFVKALRRNEKSEFEDEVNMIHRALALLQRDYSGTMLARSPNKRWVIYERHGLPCLIDTTTDTEESLGWTGGHTVWFDVAWGNSTLEKSVLWQPGGEIAAMSILLGRKEGTLWIWRHRAGLRKVALGEIVKALGVRESDVLPGGGFFTEIKGWKGDELRFDATFITTRKGELTERTATLVWNAEKNALRVISR